MFRNSTNVPRYMLCGIVLIHRNSTDQKASKLFEQGLTSLQGKLSHSMLASVTDGP